MITIPTSSRWIETARKRGIVVRWMLTKYFG